MVPESVFDNQIISNRSVKVNGIVVLFVVFFLCHFIVCVCVYFILFYNISINNNIFFFKIGFCCHVLPHEFNNCIWIISVLHVAYFSLKCGGFNPLSNPLP